MLPMDRIKIYVTLLINDHHSYTMYTKVYTKVYTPP